MNKRYLVLGLSVVLALALAVPALGGPSNPVADISASAKKTAKKALKKAKKANKKANAAQDSADNAQSSADNAQSTADNALSAAQAAQTTADGAQAAAQAAQATADSKFGSIVTQPGPTSADNGASPKSDALGCTGGRRMVSGGYQIGGTDPNDEAATLDLPYGTVWLAQAEEIDGTSPGNWNFTVWVHCIGP